MVVIEFSNHLRDMLSQRNISELWVRRTVEDPDYFEDHDDGTRHYLKKIAEYDNRWLRVVVNNNEKPGKGVTAFFDRRLRGKT